MEAKNYRITVIGAGTMGSGIAQVAATAGETVCIYDTQGAALKKAESAIKNNLSRTVEKGRMSAAEAEGILNRIIYTSTLQDAEHSDCVIEAIVENLDVKKSLFAQLEALVSDECILASNTSSLSIASIASACSKPGRVIGIHFFNPAPLMKLVEVIPAIQSHPQTLEWAISLMHKWGKTPAQVKDTPGFIVNRVARPYYSEALRMYDEGIADFATIDHAMKTIGGFKMGPFELMDFIGNDVNYAVTESVFTAFYFDPRYKPSFTQKRLSEAGYWGRKTGRGYYTYGENAAIPQATLDETLHKAIFTRIVTMLINEAADALHFGIASATDIDNAMKWGVNYPKGLLLWADELGIDACVNVLDALYDEYREDRYRCSVLLRRMAHTKQTFF
jgi:3-hydroxybutyryl-CoA dehydrogenase